MKRLMIVGGGKWQVPLIKRAKELGYFVFNTNLYEDSVGFQFSDCHEVIDILNIEENVTAAKKHKIELVVSDQTDIAVPTVAFVAKEINAKSIGIELAELFTNKYRMREFCEKKGYSVPQYKLCLNIEDAKKFFIEINKKVIIKPLDSQSSRGVYVIENITDLDQYFTITKSYSKDKKSVLIEQYIEGREFTIDGIVVNNKHISTAVSKKTHYTYNPNIAKRLFFSFDDENYDYNALRNQHDKLIKETGLPFGLTHAEYKYEDGKFYLIEVAARGGGTKISSDIVPYISGVDNYKLLLQSLEENYIADLSYEYIEKFKERCAVLEFLDIDSNGKKIKCIQGVEIIEEIEEVLDFCLEFKVGDTIQKAEDDRSRIGYFIVCAENKEKVETITKRVKELLIIEYEEEA